ncbi:biopolymer transport protein ExbD/biopolymer transport protein TolR [Rhizobiales bacterium GAS191]|jgi:biopolymer transport protein TolR|nr:biopolymer transport protein ExbD/biopolymer transport protein TolR [Rhizobiales bacterium GAS113]SEE35672.1 biopolymer transport protein ExbD/biopolymer transport protein TolR [Rhizobiales bacterium GAS191]
MAGAPKLESSLYRPLAEINVTPLVDVMLVLLIVFMITAPLLATGMRVDLPQAKAAPVDPKEPVIVTVRKDGATFLGTEQLPPGGLGAAMHAKIGDNPATLIHLRGDREARYGEIVTAMDELARAGFAKIALITTTQGHAERQAVPAPAATP